MTRAPLGLLVGALAWAPAAVAASQTLGGGGGAEVPVWRVLGALVICLTLAVAAAVALRARLGAIGVAPPPVWGGRLGGRETSGVRERRLRVLESVRLSHQVDVCLMTCDEREFIVATSPEGAFLISALAQGPAA